MTHLRFRRRSRSLPFAEMEWIDLRLVRLGRGVGALRLSLGEGLVALDGAGGVMALGFPTLESYAREALGRSGRWASDVRGMARRLMGLPLLRAELMAGRLSGSMVELVARVATADDEGAWVERALGMRVREMRALLKTSRAALLAGLDDDTGSLSAKSL